MNNDFYREMKDMASELLGEFGGPFVVESQTGKKRRGFMTTSGIVKSNRDNTLRFTETATGTSNVEVNKGDIVYFTRSRERFRVIECNPSKPAGETDVYGAGITWSISLSR